MKARIFAAIFVIATISFTLGLLPPAHAQASIWTDKDDYSPEETVTIFGTGFLPYSLVQVSLTRPDSNVDSWNTTSDAAGNFTTTYLLDGILGL